VNQFSFLIPSVNHSSSILVNRASFTMGTVVNLAVYGESEAQCNHAINRAFEEINRIDTFMSVYKNESQLSLVNREAGKRGVAVDRSIVDVLKYAQRLSEITSGAFDVTIEPLMRLWGFRSEVSDSITKPSDKQIAKTLEAVGYQNISINEKELPVGLLNSESRIDLGGIAVGYAVDSAVKVLQAKGITSALLNHSGDIFALGAPREDDSWEIGITDPLQPGSIITSVRIKDQALSTSGNYCNFRSFDDDRYGHILDPKQGLPTSNVLSTTIISNNAIEADALSTASFVTGIDKTRRPNKI